MNINKYCTYLHKDSDSSQQIHPGETTVLPVKRKTKEKKTPQHLYPEYIQTGAMFPNLFSMGKEEEEKERKRTPDTFILRPANSPHNK